MKCLLLVIIFGIQLAYAAPLKLTTFNIKWFGLGGWLGGSIEHENRIPALKSFWQENLADVDVLMFQEIVDTALFARDVVPANYNCETYQSSWEKHQHVMICYKKQYHFVREVNDDNFIMEEISFGRYRPAISGVLTDLAGKKLIHLLGVHLKAKSNASSTRIAQVEKMAELIGQFDDDLPVAIMGDFNTYLFPYNGQIADDAVLFSEILAPLGLKLVENKLYTYATKWSGRIFDHFWVSSSIELLGELSVFESCRRNSEEHGLLDISIYNKEISDHCPVTIELELQ